MLNAPVEPFLESVKAEAADARHGAHEESADELTQRLGRRLRQWHETDGAKSTAPFALLLVRLERHDRPRLVLPTASVASAMDLLRQRLETALQGEDRFAILDPNEILIYLARVPSASVAQLAMSRLIRALTVRREEPGAAREILPAIGGAMPSAQTAALEQLAALADSACELAGQKEERQHLLVGGEPAPDRRDLVPEARAAIEGNRLEVHYQPQFCLRSGGCHSVEALVRWPRPAGKKPETADVLVDVAHRHGLMPALTRFVLNTALRETQELAAAGIEVGVAVNLAPSLLSDPELPDTVAQALSVWNVPAEQLTLEITEASDLGNSDLAMDTMTRLHALGTRLSIDDFGTGHSSLARLRAMPLAELKIDRLFVGNMNRSREDLQIVHTVINLAHNFELEVVAEGVEDVSTARHLRALGCDILQGYLVARPMPAAALRAWWPQRPAGSAWRAPL